MFACLETLYIFKLLEEYDGLEKFLRGRKIKLQIYAYTVNRLLRRNMQEKFKVVISGLSGRFPECKDIDQFKEKLYNGDEFVTIDDRKWPVGYRNKSTHL